MKRLIVDRVARRRAAFLAALVLLAGTVGHLNSKGVLDVL
jgi:hypothetical protein